MYTNMQFSFMNCLEKISFPAVPPLTLQKSTTFPILQHVYNWGKKYAAGQKINKSLNIPNCAAETSVHKKNYLPLSRCIFQKEHLMHSNKENNALLCQTLQQRTAICLIPERQFVFFLLGKCCRLTVLSVFHRG